MPVWTLGLNHHTAPLEIRGRFAGALAQIEPALHGLRQRFPQHPEAAIITTCNRTEIYCASPHAGSAAFDHTLHWLADAGQMPADALRTHTYSLRNDAAARHAFRVASGLDSMVLGEPQILGQMKTAVRAAHQAGSLGQTLHQLFQRSFAVAKQVRSSTAIGAHSISMAAAAVKLAMRHMGDVRQARVLFVGAGEMIQLACTHFAAQQPQHICIANRHPGRGAALAARAGGSVMPLASLPARLHAFDVVVSCTASTLPLIGLGAVESALKKRNQRPMLLIDLAVPRDIEPEVQALPGVHLYTVDDMATLVQTHQASRQAAVAQAEAMVDNGVRHFMHWLQQRDPQQGAVPLIRHIQQQNDAWQQQELAHARKLLAKGEPVDAVLQTLARRLGNKAMHGALRHLRNAPPDEQLQSRYWVEKLLLYKKR